MLRVLRVLQSVASVAKHVLCQCCPRQRALPTGTLQEASLLLLATWAEGMRHHSELVHGGALPAFILALQCPSSTSHMYGARALARLSVHEYYRPLIVREGAAEPLLRALRSPVGDVRISAGRALCNLSFEVAGECP